MEAVESYRFWFIKLPSRTTPSGRNELHENFCRKLCLNPHEVGIKFNTLAPAAGKQFASEYSWSTTGIPCMMELIINIGRYSSDSLTSWSSACQAWNIIVGSDSISLHLFTMTLENEFTKTQMYGAEIQLDSHIGYIPRKKGRSWTLTPKKGMFPET